MNDLMSGGLTAPGRTSCHSGEPPKTDAPFGWLDPRRNWRYCFRALDTTAQARATVIDINADCLQVGRERAGELGRDDAITFVRQRRGAPFPDRSFDAVPSPSDPHVPPSRRHWGNLFACSRSAATSSASILHR